MILNLLITGFFEIVKVYAVRHMVDEWLRIKRKKKEIKDKTIHCHQDMWYVTLCVSLSPILLTVAHLYYGQSVCQSHIFIQDHLHGGACVNVSLQHKTCCRWNGKCSAKAEQLWYFGCFRKEISIKCRGNCPDGDVTNADVTKQTAKYFVVLPQLHVTCFKETSLFLWCIPGFRWQMSELQTEKHSRTHRWTCDEFW